MSRLLGLKCLILMDRRTLCWYRRVCSRCHMSIFVEGQWNWEAFPWRYNLDLQLPGPCIHLEVDIPWRSSDFKSLNEYSIRETLIFERVRWIRSDTPILSGAPRCSCASVRCKACEEWFLLDTKYYTSSIADFQRRKSLGSS